MRSHDREDGCQEYCIGMNLEYKHDAGMRHAEKLFYHNLTNNGDLLTTLLCTANIECVYNQ